MSVSIAYLFGSTRRALLAGLILMLALGCLLVQLVTAVDLSLTVLSLSCLLLLLSLFFGKASWFYSIFAGQFLLGAWLKVLIHREWDFPFIEPTGRFLFSTEQWSEFCLFASCAALGLAFGRLAVVGLTASDRNRVKRVNDPTRTRITNKQWLIFLAAALSLYYFNGLFSIYVSGVNPTLTLPLGLNAPLSFLLFLGIPLTLCTLVSFDVQARGQLTPAALFTVLTLLLISSVSTASRAPLITHAVPILLSGLLLQRAIARAPIRWSIFVTWLLFLLSSLALVSIVRIFAYIEDAVLDADAATFYLEQSLSLFLDRWLGAEAIMAAVGESRKSFELFISLVTEDPAAGTDSLYQQISGSFYAYSPDFTFATWPGFFGIVSLSGSAWFILACSASIAFVGELAERTMSFLLGRQPVTIALAVSTLSFWIYQTTVPRLFLPFIFQLIVFAGLLGFFGRRASSAKRRRSMAASSPSFR